MWGSTTVRSDLRTEVRDGEEEEPHYIQPPGGVWPDAEGD
jgi:hypothetical protein